MAGLAAVGLMGAPVAPARFDSGGAWGAEMALAKNMVGLMDGGWASRCVMRI